MYNTELTNFIMVNTLSPQKQQYVRSRIHTASLLMRNFSLGQDRYARQYWMLPELGGIIVEGVETSLHGNLQSDLRADEGEAYLHGNLQSDLRADEGEAYLHGKLQSDLRVDEGEICLHGNLQSDLRADEGEACLQGNIQSDSSMDEGVANDSRMIDIENDSDETGMEEQPMEMESGEFVVREENQLSFERGREQVEPELQGRVEREADKQVEPELRGRVEREADKQVEPELRGRVEREADKQVEPELQGRVEREADKQVEPELQGRVEREADKQVEPELRGRVEREADKQVEPELRGRVEREADKQVEPELIESQTSDHPNELPFASFNSLNQSGRTPLPWQPSPVREEAGNIIGVDNVEHNVCTLATVDTTCGSQKQGDATSSGVTMSDSQQLPHDSNDSVMPSQGNNDNSAAAVHVQHWFSLLPREPCESIPQVVSSQQQDAAAVTQQYVMGGQYAYVTPSVMNQPIVQQMGVGYALVGNTLVPQQYINVNSTQQQVQYVVSDQQGVQYVIQQPQPQGVQYISLGGNQVAVLPSDGGGNQHVILAQDPGGGSQHVLLAQDPASDSGGSQHVILAQDPASDGGGSQHVILAQDPMLQVVRDEGLNAETGEGTKEATPEIEPNSPRTEDSQQEDVLFTEPTPHDEALAAVGREAVASALALHFPIIKCNESTADTCAPKLSSHTDISESQTVANPSQVRMW